MHWNMHTCSAQNNDLSPIIYQPTFPMGSYPMIFCNDVPTLNKSTFNRYFEHCTV